MDPLHPATSTFLTVCHNMAILTHRYTVYIAKIQCLSLWRNVCSFDLPTPRSRVRIQQGFFSMNSGKKLKVHFIRKIEFFSVIFQPNICQKPIFKIIKKRTSLFAELFPGVLRTLKMKLNEDIGLKKMLKFAHLLFNLMDLFLMLYLRDIFDII